MNYLWYSAKIILAIILMAVFSYPAQSANTELKTDYSRLVELIKIEDKQLPLYVFQDFENDFDEESHRALLDHFNNQPDLIQGIKTELGEKSLRWRLADLEYRVLFVPEKRAEYAALYESYCRDVVNDLLEMTNLENPINDILTLTRGEPDIPEEHGVSAFLVHNLVKEFSGTYIFFNQKQKKVKIQLEGKVFSGEVGAYSTDLKIMEDGSFEFVNDNYTIWQNSAKNPYTALMVPVEETLHIALREHTQQAILNNLEKKAVKDLKGARKIIEDWVSVEEGIVGGLVHSLMPRILDNYLDRVPSRLVEKDLETKSQLIKFRYLKRGIELVEDLGYQKALHLYKTDPGKFRDMLILPHILSTRRFPGPETKGAPCFGQGCESLALN
ncbi:MAG: hypothetical protein V2I56_18860 [Desulfobacteraceae bacterium]|nr:hypothetical protein [Desulfobacteraceae bacterium]